MEKVLQPLNEKAASIIAKHIGEHSTDVRCSVELHCRAVKTARGSLPLLCYSARGALPADVQCVI